MSRGGLLAAMTILFVVGPVGDVLAHGGGLDAYGCHHDRKRGGYHCHRGPLAGRAFASKGEMLRVLREREAPQRAPQTPPSPTPQPAPKR